jgi:hypothetical protein
MSLIVSSESLQSFDCFGVEALLALIRLVRIAEGMVWERQ